MGTDVYTAFGNKVRTKLLLCLEKRSKSVSEIIETCGLSQSAVSQHLAKLRDAKLVTVQKKGKQVFYSLSHPRAADISKKLVELESEVI